MCIEVALCAISMPDIESCLSLCKSPICAVGQCKKRKEEMDCLVPDASHKIRDFCFLSQVKGIFPSVGGCFGKKFYVLDPYRELS